MVLALLNGIAGACQSNAVSDPPNKANSITNRSSPNPDRAITIDEVVTDKTGKVVQGLPSTAFTLRDNSQPRSLTSFHEASGIVATPDPPVTLILLVDARIEDTQTLAHERQELERYFQENGAHLALPTSLIILSDRGMKIENHPTRDGREFTEFLKQNWEILGHTGPITVEHTKSSLMTLDALASALIKTPGRKLVLWLGRGWMPPNRFSSDPRTDDQLGFKYIAALFNELCDARMTVYSIDPTGVGEVYRAPGLPSGFPSAYYAQIYFKSANPKHVEYNVLRLQVIAAQTGGRVFFENNCLASMINQSIADASSYYILSFDSEPAMSPNEFHKIEIQVSEPGLSVRTRASYYSQP
jgi:VWFA-related protein